MTNTVQPLPRPTVGSIEHVITSKVNKGLMVQWINADLMSRMGHDVRKSIVFYDEARVFETAMLPADWQALADAGKRDEFLSRLCAATPIRYWSKGVK